LRPHALSSCTHMIIEWTQNLFKFLKLFGEAHCDRKNHGDKRRSLQRLVHSKRIAQFYVRPHGMGDCEFTETGRTTLTVRTHDPIQICPFLLIFVTAVTTVSAQTPMH